ncbi:DNA replication protein psf2 [Cymbomonas tetramitiformis]|uniref:DNA replication complex GINS protein PSF2 n=1 Tax=Cymbomonas tetramitiformis TaxID=36881 RepID=A0AAE0EUV5_9CHLO|nr:DNA replication protein psf2 [Cymbomonas tetramitiformis]
MADNGPLSMLSMSNDEMDFVEFCAGMEPIDIIPNFSYSRVQIIDGEYGPFRPQMQVSVPFWLAMLLKSRRRCAIVPPTWLALEQLEKVLDEERSNQAVFQPLPFHYIEVSEQLLKNAKDDIPDLHLVREKLRDLQSVRHNKITNGMNQIDTATTVELDNLAGMEIATIRSFFVGTLNRFHLHEKKAEEAATRAAEAARAASEAARARAPGATEAPQNPRQLRRPR